MALVSLEAGWRRPVWLGALIALSLVFTLGFACAAPLAAFAAVGALTLGRRGASALILAVWLANQFAGFAFLHYPLAFDAFAWGLALGCAALLATLAAQWVKGRLRDWNGIVKSGAAFLAAFAAYEGALLAVAALSASGLQNFAAAVILRIFAINAASFAVLLLFYRACFDTRVANSTKAGVRGHMHRA
jgi:hypothetical protein